MTEISALLDHWVQGWMLSRRMVGRPDGEGWLVEVDADTRARERISATPSLAELDRLVAATSGPDAWLTLVGDLDARSLEALAPLDRVTSDESMMTAALLPTPAPERVLLEADGPVAHARIEVDGELAARGQAAVRAGDCVFDRVETTTEFCRRGLGRLVVTGLSAWAADHGATTGILMASVSGRRLYDSLGWSEVSPLATFRGRPD
ncbi:hypothetical protein GRS96_01690 [Rathayibacter sp. VKM Ac-2803]|uniref:GNAT family N-acetyltransferase n=1 Tax=unclassified Rathayibacter TaxID=2609250 RepID=UPI001357E28B|nr:MULTISPECIES: hypothetical protein [unclassified Rathayibacter]MWV47984.1 hypothetical protein [Rathayibacter sp. VKM Ac-2803]MWV58791.1 hypothetical protein [Rathayibacter sp. VKM Ac-2754]